MIKNEMYIAARPAIVNTLFAMAVKDAQKVFAERLRARVAQLGLKDAEAARRLDLDPKRFNNYTNGSRKPDFDTILKICDGLNVTPDYLFGYRDSPNPNGNVATEHLDRSALVECLEEYLNLLGEVDVDWSNREKAEYFPLIYARRTRTGKVDVSSIIRTIRSLG